MWLSLPPGVRLALINSAVVVVLLALFFLFGGKRVLHDKGISNPIQYFLLSAILLILLGYITVALPESKRLRDSAAAADRR